MPQQPHAASWQLSPNFIPIVATFVVSGALLFTGSLYSKVGVFVFVLSGWVLSLCLHEGAHALAAWHGGDRSVADKGYLSLNPLAFADPLTSIVFPVLILLLGGIGLPGGAVYVNHRALRSRDWDAFVSLAGPLANLAFLVVLALPFLLGLNQGFGTPIFWGAIAFLAVTQASAIILNMLPVPGFDGFGVIRPYLPYRMQASLQNLGLFASILILVLLMSTGFGRLIWLAVVTVVGAFDIDPAYIFFGYSQFRFWR